MPPLLPYRFAPSLCQPLHAGPAWRPQQAKLPGIDTPPESRREKRMLRASHSARHLEKQSMKKLIMNFAPMLLALMFVSPVYSKGAGSTLRIVRDSLLENGNFYFVKGAIYNPNSMAVKNVVIKYYVWKNGWDRMVMASASSRLAAWSWRTSNTSLRSKPWNSPLRAVTMRP